MKRKMTLTNYIGIVLMITSILLFFIMYNFSNTMLNLIDSGQIPGSCMAYETCPHIMVINQAYVGYVLAAVIFLLGLFLFVSGCKEAASPSAEKKDGWERKIKTLTGDEKIIYQGIVDAGGVIFQGDLVEKSGFPKAKVSRILDRMEAGGLVERKRRGMTNAVVLK